jgi:hypothetical protein
MVKLFLDTEFNGFGGEMISLALVPETGGNGLYFVFPHSSKIQQWVRDNVIPFLYLTTTSHEGTPVISRKDAAYQIASFLRNYSDVVIVADWAEDLANFLRLLLVAPGQCVNLGQDLKFELVTGNLPELVVENAIPHNAWWDAITLREKYIRRLRK